MKAVPHFGQCNGGDEKAGRVLGVMPSDQAGIGSRFFRPADCVRVEHEVHRRTGLTRSSGIRGGCQSVVKRIESCHALSFCMERRALVLRRDAWEERLRAVACDWRSASQFNNSRAWPSESLLTFLTAISTVLMMATLAKELVSSKGRFETGETGWRRSQRISSLGQTAETYWRLNWRQRRPGVKWRFEEQSKLYSATCHPISTTAKLPSTSPARLLRSNESPTDLRELLCPYADA